MARIAGTDNQRHARPTRVSTRSTNDTLNYDELNHAVGGYSQSLRRNNQYSPMVPTMISTMLCHNPQVEENPQ